MLFPDEILMMWRAAERRSFIGPSVTKTQAVSVILSRCSKPAALLRGEIAKGTRPALLMALTIMQYVILSVDKI